MRDQGSGASILAVLVKVAAVVVTYKEVELTLQAVASLKGQTAPVDEIVVVDNDPERSIREPLAREHPEVRLLELDNPGHAVGCNRGAELATGDVLVFLDPDAALAPDALEQMLVVLREHPRAGLVSPQVLFADRPTVNAGDNPVHLTGLSWCGRYDQPAEDGPPRRTFTTTGACHVVRADAFREVGGYCEDYFVLYDDPDLCWRLWLADWEVWFAPAARGVHDYHFGENPQKWFWLERHRLSSVLVNYEGRTLALLAPLVLAGELGLLLVAAREGWLGRKLAAYRSLWASRRDLLARRRAVQSARRVRDREILPMIAGRIDSGQLDNPLIPVANPLLAGYHRALLALL
jgi:GT2 family glycosyltransferase